MRGDARNLCSFVGRHFGNALGKLVEAVAPILDEFVIVEILGYDDV